MITPLNQTELDEAKALVSNQYAHPLMKHVIETMDKPPIKVSSEFQPHAKRIGLQNKLKTGLRRLALHDQKLRKKGKVLGDGDEGSFRVHISIHQDTPEKVSSLDEVFVNYMVTGDIPTPKSVGTIMRHKGKVKITKVLSDFSDNLPATDGLLSQAEIIKQEINSFKEMISTSYVFFAGQHLAEHYQAMSDRGICHSCMSKETERYDADGLHPINAYNNSPNLRLGLSLRSLNDLEGSRYSFVGRRFYLFDLDEKLAGYGYYYGNEGYNIHRALRDADVENNITSGIITAQYTDDGELIVPYVDNLGDYANRLHWIKDAPDHGSVNQRNTIHADWMDNDDFIHCGEIYDSNYTWFQVVPTDDSPRVCRLEDVSDAERDWLDGLSENTTDYVRVLGRDERYPESDTVWSEYHDEHIHQDDYVFCEDDSNYYHEDDVDDIIIDLGDGIYVLKSNCVYLEYKDIYAHANNTKYCVDIGKYFLFGEQAEFYAYHDYVQARDIYGELDYHHEDDVVYSEYRGEDICQAHSIETPNGEYIYAEDIPGWLEGHPEYEYKEDCQTFVEKEAA